MAGGFIWFYGLCVTTSCHSCIVFCNVLVAPHRVMDVSSVLVSRTNRCSYIVLCILRLARVVVHVSSASVPGTNYRSCSVLHLIRLAPRTVVDVSYVLV